MLPDIALSTSGPAWKCTFVFLLWTLNLHRELTSNTLTKPKKCRCKMTLEMFHKHNPWKCPRNLVHCVWLAVFPWFLHLFWSSTATQNALPGLLLHCHRIGEAFFVSLCCHCLTQVMSACSVKSQKCTCTLSKKKTLNDENNCVFLFPCFHAALCSTGTGLWTYWSHLVNYLLSKILHTFMLHIFFSFYWILILQT